MHQLNWDNLRYVLMVANRGSISAAARELGVNRSTVLRRIDRFQQDLNCRIFKRSAEGYALTPEAEKMINAAREVESTLFNLQRQLAGHELLLEGELRVTTTDTFMFSLLSGPLARFRQRHPHILIDLLVTNQVLDLSRHDADIAIRPTQKPDAGFVGRKLRDIQFAIYAAKSRRSDTPGNWRESDWVGVTDSLHRSPIGSWFEQHLHAHQVVIRCDSLVAVRACAEEAMGMALLPCELGDQSPLLERIENAPVDLKTGLWLLTHPDLARSAKVSAFMDHLSHELSPQDTQPQNNKT
jgi:DNA-binding transcriptional LysR family regulator